MVRYRLTRFASPFDIFTGLERVSNEGIGLELNHIDQTRYVQLECERDVAQKAKSLFTPLTAHGPVRSGRSTLPGDCRRTLAVQTRCSTSQIQYSMR